MSEGLTRRRGVANSPTSGPSSTLPSPNGPTPSSSSGPKRPGANVPLSEAGGRGGTGAIEGRGKVAYDPRDFEDKDEAEVNPKLTIMEEIVLLGLKDKAVSSDLARDRSLLSSLGFDTGIIAETSTGVPVILERQHLICPSWLHPHRTRLTSSDSDGQRSITEKAGIGRSTHRGH